MFDRILIANRAEIAVRIARTCRELDVTSVALFSDVDTGARHVRACDEAVHLRGITASETYGNADAVLTAARAAGVDAVHPGYGFLAESADFASAVADAGLVWIGPPPAALRAVGDKIEARRMAERTGVPVVPGLTRALEGAGEVRAWAAEHGYPVALKAAGGGGGRGIRVARADAEVPEALEGARREAAAYFGGADVYLERYLENPRHHEVQILCPAPGRALWVGVRDCSLQRRNQKLVEESPPARPLGAPEMGRAAVALAEACGYVGAGTVEMLVDGEAFFFLEINARLQVEHTVTEEVFGLDLVACQLRIASGDPLGLSQDDLFPRGHAIECRVNAEDPAHGFAPSPGVIRGYAEPGGPGVRVDSGYGEGDEVPRAYDSLIAKVIASAPTREAARRRMLRALGEMRVEGPRTTLDLHARLLESEEFRSGLYTTRTVEDLASRLPSSPSEEGRGRALMVAGRSARLWNPAGSRAPDDVARAGPGGPARVAAPMQATVVRALVARGQSVEAGAPLLVLEAMKMETTLVAPAAGVVEDLSAAPGETVEAGRVLAVIA